jgi:histidinol-phosphate aminotransferase
MYEMSTRLAGSRFVGVPLANDFNLDLPAMLAAIDEHQPAVVFLAYPNNPTGNCFSREAIETILSRAPGLVVLDEAYQPFALDTWMSALAQWPNLIVMRTLSKLGLAGLRLGYMAAATHWLVEFDKVRPPYNVGVLNEIAAEFALEHLDVLDAQAAQLRQARASLTKALRGLAVTQVFDSRANFILIRVTDSAATHARLRECGILVKDVGRMHPLLANCLRLTVGTPAENSALVDALRLVLSERPKAV